MFQALPLVAAERKGPDRPGRMGEVINLEAKRQARDEARRRRDRALREAAGKPQGGSDGPEKPRPDQGGGAGAG